MRNEQLEEGWTQKYIVLEATCKAKNCFDDPQIKVMMLEKCGVDLNRPEAIYPYKTVKAVMNLLAEHYYPTLPPEEGQYRLGYETLEGYRRTIMGQVMSAILKIKFIPPERILQSAVKGLNDADNSGVRQLVKRGPTAYTIPCRQDSLDPYRTWGISQALLDTIGLPGGKASLNRSDEYDFDINLNWQDKNGK